MTTARPSSLRRVRWVLRWLCSPILDVQTSQQFGQIRAPCWSGESVAVWYRFLFLFFARHASSVRRIPLLCEIGFSRLNISKTSVLKVFGSKLNFFSTVLKQSLNLFFCPPASSRSSTSSQIECELGKPIAWHSDHAAQPQQLGETENPFQGVEAVLMSTIAQKSSHPQCFRPYSSNLLVRRQLFSFKLSLNKLNKFLFHLKAIQRNSYKRFLSFATCDWSSDEHTDNTDVNQQSKPGLFIRSIVFCF